MRFYKVTTPHNQYYINDIIKNMSSVELESVVKLYGKISMVEYTDEGGSECMFTILDDFLVSELENIYKKYNIKFIAIDLTKEVIFDDKFKTKYKNYLNISVQKEILSLIEEFKINWVSKDDILDKILEKGIDSLTDIDLDILNS